MSNPDQFSAVAAALDAVQGNSREPLRFDVTLASGKEVSIMDRAQYEILRDAAGELERLKKEGRITPEAPMTDEDRAMIEKMTRDE